MVRGGVRLGSGAKSKWKNGKTTTIRVPKVLIPQILEYAEKLDSEGIIENETLSKILNLSGVSIRQHNGITSIYLEDLVKLGYEIQPESLSNLVKARIQKLEMDKQLKNGNNTQKRPRN
jgi:hypothetical protein